MKTFVEEAEALAKKFIEPTKVPNAKGILVEDLDGAKQCAIIAVEAILEETRHYQDLVSIWQKEREYTVIERITYWKQVLNHLNQM